MNIFDFRNQLIDDYASYIKSFIQIRDAQIGNYVRQKLQEGVLWPEPLIQLNPLFERGESIDELVAQAFFIVNARESFAKINPKMMIEVDRCACININPRRSVLHGVVQVMFSLPVQVLEKALPISSPSSIMCCAMAPV